MNNRERILAVLNGKKPDKVPWFGDLSYWINYLKLSGNLPQEFSGDGMFQLHRNLDVGYYLQCYFPYKIIQEDIKTNTKRNTNVSITQIETPVGTVQMTSVYLPESYTWAIREHYVKSLTDLKVIRYIFEHTHYEADYKPTLDRYDLVGDNGIVMAFLPKSPFMEMIVQLSGIEAASFAIMDDLDEFNETMEVMEKKVDEAALISLNSPAECLMIPENLSSEVIGKKHFATYIKSYHEKWNKRIKDAGKFSFVHMDGTMKGLIKEVSLTGFSVLEALTPAPVGDIAVKELRDWVCQDTIIWGGLPGLYFTDMIRDSDFDDFVISVLEVMKSSTGYVLGVADQIPPGCRYKRIERVSELVDKYGRY